jgi:periplasmic protein CpxP/Spy
MKLTSKIIAATAATLSLALAGAVFAHPGSGMGWGPGAGMGAGMGPGGWGMGPGIGGRMGYGRGSPDMGAIAAGRAAELKYAMKITPAQETAWKSFETVLQQQAAAMQALRTQMQARMQSQAGPGGADFTAQRDAMIKQHDASQAAHAAAAKDLYAVLTPEQRAIFDSSPMAAGGPRFGRGQPTR